MNEAVEGLLDFLQEYDGIGDKKRLEKSVAERFGLIQDRSVYYCQDFAIRFSSSARTTFSNTVLSLSALQKYDDKPFIVCLVTPHRNHVLLANTTFLTKISHSSQNLRENNIRGSFNGSDIIREFEGIANERNNFARLFNIHAGIAFEDNLARLVDSTNNITPSGSKFVISGAALIRIFDAPSRAAQFVTSDDVITLKNELDQKVERFKSEILLAAMIENVNVRGRIIEYLLAGEDERLKLELVAALQANNRNIPQFRTRNTLGNYTRHFAEYVTETDVKTKIMVLDSNPKAYNLDKMLEFLSADKSVFMFYFVGVDPLKILNTVLLSVFQEKLLRSTILLKHWSGRNSRGVSQFEGRAIRDLILNPEFDIDQECATKFLKKIIAL